ncbi:haloacid dehalogenase [Dendrothele bispora CBS 962.96]|uniref:Haloacid dehalogenase n=1 Tax=Dendrothele bispora (strain CBS 962.96) TaxID=1314807 RepID=A0A4S8KSB3_DENBC|nr:haloacid dehalogenase [Dendrothele bispora CBS 962.96]
MAKQTHPLDGVEVLVFDVFGTVADWRSSVIRELEEVGRKFKLDVSDNEWAEFADEWRKGYMINTKKVAAGGEGPKDTDVMHRMLLDNLLASERWSKVGTALDEKTRADLNMVWHRLNGWPEVVSALQTLKKKVIIVALSNGNLRLLVDMAKHAQFPWDTIFSTAMYDSFKPNPIVYESTLKHLSLSSTPQKAAMVAAHLFDVRGAAKAGMKTVYVPRGSEDTKEERESVKSKWEDKERGEVDLVVKDFEELARVFQV